MPKTPFVCALTEQEIDALENGDRIVLSDFISDDHLQVDVEIRPGRDGGYLISGALLMPDRASSRMTDNRADGLEQLFARSWTLIPANGYPPYQVSLTCTRRTASLDRAAGLPMTVHYGPDRHVVVEPVSLGSVAIRCYDHGIKADEITRSAALAHGVFKLGSVELRLLSGAPAAPRRRPPAADAWL